jgi:C-terminal processing protease CtpA/Prc
MAGASILLLGACGGSGDSSNPNPQASSTYAQQCSPTNLDASANLRTASLATEKAWVRQYLDEAYLWYNEIPFVNPNAPAYSTPDAYASLDAYFQALKTRSRTPSNALTDRFSFTYPTAAWQQLSQSGVEAGYGFDLSTGSYNSAPRNIRIAYIEPGSPAATAGLKRGDLLVTVDGVSADSMTTAGVAVLNDALTPSSVGSSHSFVWSRTGTGNVSVTLVSANIAKTPVPIHSVVTATDGAKVGYMLFNDHVVPAEAQLVSAVNDFKAQGISDLVLDIRYNGGGYLYIASQLAYMIAGTQADGKVFEKLTYNDKRAAETNASSANFWTTRCELNANFSCTANAQLPVLNLARVYVITKSGTCSASESIINSLRGVNVDVRQIGSTTCGKPYGFTAKDNCGISYFPIEFKGVNAKGFGDYADGFVPAGSGPTGLPGCLVADDFGKALGDQTEGMLSAALNYRASGICPTPPASGMAMAQSAGRQGVFVDGTMLRSPARENRILLPAK